jgi:hypothetical protein
MPGPLTDVLVSIQSGHRHLTAGLLGDNDLVLVPSPPPDVLDPSGDLEVVTIPQPLGAGHPVERLRASCVNVMWLRGDRERPVAAMLKLGTPSGYPSSMGPFSGPALAVELDRVDGDLWTHWYGQERRRHHRHHQRPSHALPAGESKSCQRILPLSCSAGVRVIRVRAARSAVRPCSAPGPGDDVSR